MGGKKIISGFFVILFVIVQIVLPGCTSQRVWTYRPETKVELEPLLYKSVAVLHR